MVDRALFLSPDGITFDGRRSVPDEHVTKLMLELADLKPGEKVLEIGTGSGYQAACIAELGVELWCVDREGHFAHPPVWKGYDLNDGRNGMADQAPFDCIFVTCGMNSIPPACEEQLREGGRLIIPLGKPEGQELLRLEKRNGKLVLGRVGGYCRFQMCS